MTSPAIEELIQRVRDLWASSPPVVVQPATPTTLGGVKLRGDLGGSAESPSVPALAKKADLGSDGKVVASQLPASSGSGATSWDELTGKPATFPPSVHQHPIADVTGLQPALDGKAATSHTHPTSQITGLDTTLSGKAPVASPTFTGTVTAPTVKLTSGAAAGKVLTSSADGTASWQAASGGGVSSWNDLTDKPTEFPPAGHTHEVEYDGSMYDIDDIASRAFGAYSRTRSSTRAGFGVPHTGYWEEGSGEGHWVNESPENQRGGDVYLDFSTLKIYQFEEIN
ncbi:hypothetical protein [Prescottella agglutinans]|uniref:Uncharacterized protein n=1 Tax=Prescottella agglutinans TaxID=1644129 RepID=A0ABT6MHF6_9NOCA|nr:hypothetical protein [Prescottella agglutinans]MDH6282789.1 hypothetical protein [Prescottella agglutinans]